MPCSGKNTGGNDGLEAMQRRWVAVASASHRDHTLKIRESSLRDHTIVSILKLEMGFVS